MVHKANMPCVQPARKQDAVHDENAGTIVFLGTQSQQLSVLQDTIHDDVLENANGFVAIQLARVFIVLLHRAY